MTPERIMAVVANAYDISVAQITGRTRPEYIAFPRQVAMYLCRARFKASFEQVGKWFNRDKVTVLHACRRIDGLPAKDRKKVDKLERKLGCEALDDFSLVLGSEVLLREHGRNGHVLECKVEKISVLGDHVFLSGQVAGWFPVSRFTILDLVDNRLITD